MSSPHNCIYNTLWFPNCRMDYIEKEMSKRKTIPVSPDELPSKYVHTILSVLLCGELLIQHTFGG